MMHKRQLGKTGFEVTPVGFGGIKLPHVSEDAAAEALNTALDLGINFVDTARSYGDSEAKIGRAIGHRRREFILATKSAVRDRSGLRRELETSLAQLNMDRIDLFQLHSVSDEGEWAKAMSRKGALAEARKAQGEGLIDRIGITIHRDLGVMKKAIECGEFETIMLCYNPLDPEHVSPEAMPLAAGKGLGVIIMKALSGGLLVSDGFEEGKRAGPEDPLVTGCLRFVLSNPHVTTVIPGMRNAAEVRQNVRLAKAFKPMTEEERADLIRSIGAMRKAYRYDMVCLQCGYCQPCPQKVNTPAILRAHMMVTAYPDAVKKMGHDLYDSLEVKAMACVECRKCVKKCPAGLDVPAMLKKAGAALHRA
jgi:predicted aldo/keto reductase-like oxidoreductase